MQIPRDDDDTLSLGLEVLYRWDFKSSPKLLFYQPTTHFRPLTIIGESQVLHIVPESGTESLDHLRIEVSPVSSGVGMNSDHIDIDTGLAKGRNRWVGGDTIAIDDKREKLTNWRHRDHRLDAPFDIFSYPPFLGDARANTRRKVGDFILCSPTQNHYSQNWCTGRFTGSSASTRLHSCMIRSCLADIIPCPFMISLNLSNKTKMWDDVQRRNLWAGWCRWR